MKRTHSCGELRAKNIGNKVVLFGWVDNVRDHGGVIFVDLRDREGIVQVVFGRDRGSESKKSEQLSQSAKSLKGESFIHIEGEVAKRPEGTVNKNLPTGEIEVLGSVLEIVSGSRTPPFEIRDDLDVSEELRLKYRYLDLRRKKMQKNLILRSQVYMIIRDFFNKKGFIEVETPFLTKSTPEGARDYLVPSRLIPGHFYALPQSPQLFKQLLMVAGFDRYFQIVKCFRDEDLRRDRQPEFTQLDLELSLIEEEDIFKILEEFIKELFAKVLSRDIPIPFPRIAYEESLKRYGTDSPDIRYSLEIVELTDVFKDTDFQVFRQAIEKDGVVFGLRVEGASRFSRQSIDELTNLVKEFGAKGLAWIKITDRGWESPVAKFLKEGEKELIENRLGLKRDNLVFFLADKPEIVYASFSGLRQHLANRLGLIPQNEYGFVWIVNPPLLEFSEEENSWVSLHHPFTSPRLEDIPLLDKCLKSDKRDIRAPFGSIRSRAYDLVLNGSEIGGGSIRISNSELQEKVFRMLGISDKEAQEKFGFLLESFKYGAPPHGGFAFGLDRLVMIMAGAQSIRDVIAFPKTQRAYSPLTGAPTPVKKRQLDELNLDIVEKPAKKVNKARLSPKKRLN